NRERLASTESPAGVRVFLVFLTQILRTSQTTAHISTSTKVERNCIVSRKSNLCQAGMLLAFLTSLGSKSTVLSSCQSTINRNIRRTLFDCVTYRPAIAAEVYALARTNEGVGSKLLSVN